MKIKKGYSLIFLLFIGFEVGAQQQLSLNTSFPSHPRLLCLDGEEKSIVANTISDSTWNRLHQNIISESDKLINQPPVLNIKIGRRLLDKSRTCLFRVFYLSYAYRMTHEAKYLKRAEEEMLAVSRFADWNPTHFLDVAEMTMAVAIGYDWLYKDLSAASRVTIKEAILKKGIEPSLDSQYNGWLKGTNNWNQVCNTGIAYGAITTYEDHPELTVQIVNRAIASMALPMQQYAPNGGYPEGYGYWEYGTSFNVMFISALQVAFKNDFGLASRPGFMQTATFLENLIGSSGKPFNFSDCGNGAQFNPAILWFANRTKQPSLLYFEKKFIEGSVNINSRLLPAALVWANGLSASTIPAPNENVWISKGPNPVAMLRTSWTSPDAIFVGFKAGSPSSSHGHMDVGSFVMDANGVRWAMDLGMQEYETLESKGIDLWNMKQGSQRWEVFRYNNLAHNTISINNAFQKVSGNAIINSCSGKPFFLNIVSDLSRLYDSSLSKLVRGVAIVNESYVVVRDEVETLSDSTLFRWSMVTPTAVKIIDDSTAELTKDHKKMFLKTQLPFATKLTTWSTAPTNNYDAENTGTVIIGFEIKLPPNSKKAITVLLVPENVKIETKKRIDELALWPKK